MSSRFYQRDFFLCGLCKHVQKHHRGYKPIPNPVLFDPAEQTKAYHRETKDSVGYVDNYFMKKCDKCATVHGSWKWMDFQQVLNRKEEDATIAATNTTQQEAMTALEGAEGK